MDAPTIEIETERLKLRQWKRTDLEPFYRMNSDPRVMAHFPSVLTKEESDSLALRIQAFLEERGWGFWAMEERATGVLVGFAGLQVPAANFPFCPCTEIGWRLTFDYWGRGFATEAAEGVLRIGFERLGFREIVSFTSILNSRSRRVMERIGMAFDQEFEHPGLLHDERLRKHVLYRISKEAWKRRNRG